MIDQLKIQQFESGGAVLTNILNASIRPSNISTKIQMISPSDGTYTITDKKKIKGPTKINIDGVYFLEDEEYFVSGDTFRFTPQMIAAIEPESLIYAEYLVDNNIE